MAQRRMFSIKVIDSAKFLKMPLSTRLLYYDLGMRADDDGIVEAFNVLRMTGATEDDLRVLVAKEYIKVLNEDLVTYIIDWKEHNKLRADRKVDSMYKDLLLQIMPDVELLEPKKRADRDNSSAVDNGTSQGQPSVGIGKDRLGQDSLGKPRTGQDRTDEDSLEEVPKLEPLIFPTPIHKEIYNIVGDVGYRTWFIDTDITETDSTVSIKAQQEFKRDIIISKYIPKLHLGKRIEVS
ncbi:hypothetical protein ACFO6R_13370 [Eubacterium multiforme]|uniref:Uncharacterized protein n=1 Tax=Eubacterium multiforme TaxID=83339 RepID=A0ABT9UXX1_9FIRM|nr:hypothetical protein [Eubacterium multiforme]MDQ0151165.1 hypothetical protein [Eubacterium multiforme]